MSKPRILFAPAREHTAKVFAAEVLARLEAQFDLDRNDRDDDLAEAELTARISGCDGLVTGWGATDPQALRPRGALPLTPGIMEAADRLKIIAHAAGSVRRMLGAVWHDYIAARGICVFNATVEIGYNVAETAVGFMIMSAKRLLEYGLHVRHTQGWRSPHIPVDEQHLTGATVGIVGASDVGREVMRLLRPFAVRLLLYDPYLDAAAARALQAEQLELDELFARADIVSLHAPSIPETEHLVGAAQLRRLRDGAVLVNTARGSLIDHEALIREAGSGRIRVALDVTTPEPLPGDSPLRSMPNVIITPHLAGQGRYGHHRIGAATLQALEDFFAGRPVTGAIDHARWERAGMSAPLRFAQLGVAHSHAAGKAAVMRANPDVELVGVWEPDAALRATAQALPEYAGVRWLQDAGEALDDPAVAAVAVEGDVLDNLAWAERSVTAGKHVWLDKPPGADMTAFRRIMALAGERDLLVQLGYMFRYNPGARFLLDWARSGRLGEVHSVQGRISLTPQQSHRMTLQRLPGGPAFEILCHVTDLVVALLGRPERVVSILRDHVADLSGSVNNTVVTLEYPRALAVLQSTAFEVDHGFRRLEVHGTRGSVALGPIEPPAVRLSLDCARDGFAAGMQEVPLMPEPRYVASLAAIVAVIRGDQPRDRSAEHELMVQETILRAVGRLSEPSGGSETGGGPPRPVTPGSDPSSVPASEPGEGAPGGGR